MTQPQADAQIVKARHESFLRQTIVHSIGLTRGPANTTGAHADAAVNAWWAHRLLSALAEAIPDEIPALLADISDELQMGYAHEAAYEDARALGIDVDALETHAEAKFAGTSTAEENHR